MHIFTVYMLNMRIKLEESLQSFPPTRTTGLFESDGEDGAQVVASSLDPSDHSALQPANATCCGMATVTRAALQHRALLKIIVWIIKSHRGCGEIKES